MVKTFMTIDNLLTLAISQKSNDLFADLFSYLSNYLVVKERSNGFTFLKMLRIKVGECMYS
jgi:hypothetical protein